MKLLERRLTLADLVRMFVGERYDAWEWSVEPCYSAPLAEEICRLLAPETDLALIRTVMLDGSEALTLSRELVGAEAWDALTAGFMRWKLQGKPRS